MKLRAGPLQIAFAEPNRPALGEIGTTGTTIFSGLLQEEDYNPDLRGDQFWRHIDEMRYGDGTVRALLRVMKLPILQAEASIVPASDDGIDQEIADFISADLFDSISASWQEVMHHALLQLDFGHFPFEKVWEVRDDRKIHLHKLAYRMPQTISEWQVEDDGGLRAIVQDVQSGLGYKKVTIPVDKLLVFINDKEGGNYKGVSALRSVYPHWYYKTGLYKIDAIGKERRAHGVDVGSLGPDATPEDRRQAERALRTIHSHEKMYMTEISGKMSYRIEGISGNTLDPMTSITHHDLMILRSGLAQFLDLGSGGVGSWALSSDQSSFFIMSLGALADQIAYTFNKYLIAKWVGYNWANVDQFPKLEFSRLDTRNVSELADAVEKFTLSGMDFSDRETQEAIRTILDLPELPEEEELPETPPPPPEPEVPAMPPEFPSPFSDEDIAEALSRIRDSERIAAEHGLEAEFESARNGHGR